MPNNEYVNKVQKSDGTPLIDITDTTAIASDVAQGKYFYLASGQKVAGTSSGGGGGAEAGHVWQDAQGYVHLSDEAGTYTEVEAATFTSNGTYTAPSGTAYSPVTVNVAGGGGSAVEGGLRMYDYDGTLLHSYTVDEVEELSALPANPSHTGLTAQGWNWTLSDIQDYLEDYPEAIVNVGQLYITNDGKTRFYIHIDEDTPSSRLTFYIRFRSSTSNNVTIDWGDNQTETKGSTTATNYPHTYATGGDYVITLTVNSGTIDFYSISNSGNIYGPTGMDYYYNKIRIQKIEVGDNVTEFSQSAFTECYSLKTITIPRGIVIRANSIFYNCRSLEYVTIPEGIVSPSYTFYNCQALKVVSLPNNGMTSVNENLFYNCYSLTSVTVPSSATSIAGFAFSGCSSLEAITIPDTVTTIGGSAFSGCSLLPSINIPSAVTSIGTNAFKGCFSLDSMALPQGLTTISNNTFQNCHSLRSVTIPNTVTSIGNYAFQYCESLLSITIPSGVTSIGTNAFDYCYALKNVILPSGITSIGTSTFDHCSALESVEIKYGVTSIGGYAFRYCYTLKEIAIPNSVTSISSSCFTGDTSLKSVTLSTNITTITANTFSGATSLEKITLPSGITSIAGSAFMGCNFLISITIPSTVTSIGTQAFSSCYSVAEYHLLPETPPTLTNTNTFSGIQADCIIYVPYSSDHSILEAYQTADYWSTYASYMQEEVA